MAEGEPDIVVVESFHPNRNQAEAVEDAARGFGDVTTSKGNRLVGEVVHCAPEHWWENVAISDAHFLLQGDIEKSWRIFDGLKTAESSTSGIEGSLLGYGVVDNAGAADFIDRECGDLLPMTVGVKPKGWAKD